MTQGTTPPGGGDAAREDEEFAGGTPAPVTATYESANLFGRRTGHQVSVQRGEALPALPRGFTWLVVTG